MKTLIERLAGSPACVPQMNVEQVLAFINGMGLTKMEVYMEGVTSAFSMQCDPNYYRQKAQAHNIRFISVQLPEIDIEREETLEMALKGVEFTKRLNAPTVIMRPANFQTCKEWAGRLTHTAEKLDLRMAVQNIAGAGLSTAEELQRLADEIDEERLKFVLDIRECGKADADWKAMLDVMQERLVLVHLADTHDKQCVEYGKGDIDFADLFGRLQNSDYDGYFVVKLEGTQGYDWQRESTKKAVQFLCDAWEETE
ncbi:MAG: sugar phosphate isomerase/epimerase family protein [Candidatus Sumerlaeia bacterium]